MQQDAKGLVLLHGLPGTGKTSYIRYLIRQLDKEVIFIPPNMAYALTNPDFIKLFDSYGIEGTRVATVAELARALEQAVSADRVQLIEVETPNGFGALV